jgi:hypothetical protein
MAVFWVVVPCSLIEVYNISEIIAASIIRVMTHLPDNRIVETSETMVNFYQTTWRYNPEDSHLNTTTVRTSNLTN